MSDQDHRINDSYTRSAEETLAILETSMEGLADQAIAARQQRFGPNRLPAPPAPSLWRRWLRQFHHVLIYVLLASALVTLLLGHWLDSAVILAVVLVNAVIGFVQEGKAEQAMAAIREMLAPQAHVIRAGHRFSVDSEGLVPGDIVLLEPGDRVPADMRLLQVHGLSIQEAALTGESVPVEKHSEPLPAGTALADRQNMAFSGTLVTTGQAKGVVVAIADATELGRVSGMLATVTALTTPLVAQMTRFAQWLTGFIFLAGSLLLAYSIAVVGRPFNEAFMAVVGLSVSAIPEGLPAVLTITMAIGVQAMARRNAIVRRLPAIETIGSVSVVCSDKTGTLTRNEMMVAAVVTGRQSLGIEGEGYAPVGAVCEGGQPLPEAALAELEPLALACALCNDAGLHNHDGQWQVEGDPMEGALLTLAGKLDPDLKAGEWTRIDAIPFDAQYRYMATLNHDHHRHAVIFAKGAPEQILAMCNGVHDSGGDTGALDMAFWHEQIEALASQGQRVLAIAKAEVDADKRRLDHEDISGQLTLLGLVGLIDPPRAEAIAAVRECQQAGIRVIMITGDHAGTAGAIGRQLGLARVERVMTGQDLDTLNDAAMASTVAECDIFARTSPEHKLRLVTALQAGQQIVAMTGDGVNDAPALKRANTGIAMGKKGSQAAREAADLVLADDNFASIVAAIRQGRTVYDNLTKVIAFILPVNGGEAISLIVALLLGLTLPISATQILWINMLGSAGLALTLAFEAPESGVMRRPPRPIDQPLLSGFVIWRILFVSLLFAVGIFTQFELALARGNDLETARTMAVNTLMAMEVFYLFSIRYGYHTSFTLQGILGTRVVWIALAVVVCLQLLFTYLPFMQGIFGSSGLSFSQLLLVTASGMTVFVLIELEKQLLLWWRRIFPPPAATSSV